MDMGSVRSMLDFAADPRYGKIFAAAAKGDETALNTLVTAVGIANPTQSDLAQALNVAKIYATKPRAKSQKLDTDKLRDTTREMTKIIGGTPQETAIKAGIYAVGRGAKALGDANLKTANRLASAILGHKVNSARQDQMYGPSLRDEANNRWANTRLAKAEQFKEGTDAVSDIITRALNSYDMARNAAGHYALSQALAENGMSSGAFDTVSRGITMGKNAIK